MKISANAQTTIDKLRLLNYNLILSINTKNARLLENFKAFNSVTNLAFERIKWVCKPATCSKVYKWRENQCECTNNDRQTTAIKLEQVDFVNKENEYSPFGELQGL